VKVRWDVNITDHQPINHSTTAPQAGTSTTSCAVSSIFSTSQIHEVIVGAGNNLTFTPNTIDAGIGDIIKFTFLALNHTLTQSSLELPCTNLGGFSTGFNQFNPQNISGQYLVEYLIKTLDPQWFFCAQTKPKSHCRAGMVFALNPGSQMSSFMSAATETSLPSNAITNKITQASSTATAPTSTDKVLSLLESSSTSTSPLSILVITQPVSMPSSVSSLATSLSLATPSRNSSVNTSSSGVPTNFTGGAGPRNEIQNVLSMLGLVGAVFIGL
jgi:plastocyanin